MKLVWPFTLYQIASLLIVTVPIVLYDFTGWILTLHIVSTLWYIIVTSMILRM